MLTENSPKALGKRLKSEFRDGPISYDQQSRTIQLEVVDEEVVKNAEIYCGSNKGGTLEFLESFLEAPRLIR